MEGLSTCEWGGVRGFFEGEGSEVDVRMQTPRDFGGSEWTAFGTHLWPLDLKNESLWRKLGPIAPA